MSPRPAPALALAAHCTAWRQRPYRETLVLRDGRAVLLRPAHHRDAASLRRFFTGLSPRARLLRFHGAVNQLPDAVLVAMTTQVTGRHVALLALAPTDDGLSPVVAEARYAVDGDGTAEFALAVADAWQGLGLGRALMQRLAVHAAASGLGELHGSIVPGNEAMAALMARLGAVLRSEGSEWRARWRL